MPTKDPTKADLKALETAVAGIDDSRWAVAEVAADWKERGIRGWAEIIGQHPKVRRKVRTVRAWSETAQLRRSIDVTIDLPFSFFTRSLRFVGKLPIETIVETLQEFEAEVGADVDTFSVHLADLAKASSQQAAIARAPATDGAGWRLITANVTYLLDSIPAGSVDAIITDPPYEREFLPVYADLAQAAAQLLKPGGALVVMIGHSHLPAICAAMTPHIQYLWTVAYITPANTARVFSAHALVNWKPVLVFSNGPYAGDWYSDVVGNSAPDKRYHEWGQGEGGMAMLIERFSAAGDTVLDPFCGGSATGAAALKIGRLYIGSDFDAGAIAISAERMKGISDALA